MGGSNAAAFIKKVFSKEEKKLLTNAAECGILIIPKNIRGRDTSAISVFFHVLSAMPIV